MAPLWSGLFSLVCMIVFLSTSHSHRVQGAMVDNNTSYGVFLDLGSTGTKVNVYKWSLTSTTALPEIEKLAGEKFRPGVSNFVDRLDQLTEYLGPIIDMGKRLVPEGKRADTPIFAMATAGMRFLEANKSEALMEALKARLSNPIVSPFRYDQKEVQILSGEEEGVYSWVALNYLLGFFHSDRPTNGSTGILEMGGGSTQITFIPQEPLYAGEFQVEVLGQLYEVYTHSYLNYGLRAIPGKLAASLKPEKKINPCLLKGDHQTYTTDSGQTIELTGGSQPGRCKSLFKKVLKSADSNHCQPKPCAIGNQYQPHVGRTPFYATQAFTYAPKDVGAVSADGELDFDKLRTNGNKYCKQSLAQAVESGVNSKYASATCLEVQYFQVLFQDIYKIPETTQIKLTSKIKDQGIDWALGAVLVELSRHSGLHASVRRRR